MESTSIEKIFDSIRCSNKIPTLQAKKFRSFFKTILEILFHRKYSYKNCKKPF